MSGSLRSTIIASSSATVFSLNWLGAALAAVGAGASVAAEIALLASRVRPASATTR